MRFKEVKRAHIALWLLALLYAVSLCAELLCNNVPLYVRFDGRSFFPIFAFYPEDTFTGNGQKTRADFKQVAPPAGLSGKPRKLHGVSPDSLRAL